MRNIPFKVSSDEIIAPVQAGFIITGQQAVWKTAFQPLIALKRDVVKRLIPIIYLNDVLSACKSKGYLLSDAKGNNTRSITLNDKRVRFYCFVSPGDEENKVAVMKRNQGYAAKKSTEKKDSE